MMMEYVGMVGAQIAQVLLIIFSKYAIAGGMSSYSSIFYSNALASLILLPLSLIFHRSPNRPPLTFSVLCGFLIIGLLGTLAQLFGYTGVSYASATLATTLLNLIPGFTFLLAVLCRIEAFDLSLTTQVKFIGTAVSIAGAIIMTLYKGPSILSSLKSEVSENLLVSPSNWVLGAILLTMNSVFVSMWLIAQAFVLKKYPAEMIVMFAYSFISTILSGVASLIMEADLSSFNLLPKNRLLYVLYGGIFGATFQVTVQAWCVRKRGPHFVAMFNPIGIVISTFIGVIFLGDGIYLGSLLGSVVVVIGFYTVMWGNAKENITMVDNDGNSKLHNEEAPFLQDINQE